MTISPPSAQASESFAKGNHLAARGDYVAALACYETARTLCPLAAGIHYNIGLALARLGRESEAAQSYRRALALDPTSHAAFKGLGDVLRALGHFDEADTAYRDAITLAPSQGHYYRALAQCGRLTCEDPLFSAMTSLLEAGGAMPDSDRIALHFGLAEVLRRAGRHAAAFDHLLRGNALERTRLVYDEAAMLRMFEGVRATFTREMIATASGDHSRSALPIFIVGMPRSGTTLVEQILASHPAVFGAGEIAALPEALATLAERASGGSAGFTEADLVALGERYLARLEAAAAPGRYARVADKYPFNFLNLGLIHMALPQARVIHCRRDPVDTCLSCFAKLFHDVPFSYDLGELGRYYHAYDGLMAHWAEVLPPGIVLDLHLEDLIDDFPGQVQRLLAHCGLPWDDACLSFHRTARVVRSESAVQVRQTLRRDLHPPWRPETAILQPLLDGLRGPRCDQPERLACG